MAKVLPLVSNLSPRIIRILGCNPGQMTLQGTNTYLIGTGKKRILLDTGENNKPEYIENLKSTLHQHNISVRTIVLTHWHQDHVGGVFDVINNVDVTDDCKIYKLLGSSNIEKSKFSPEIENKLNYLTDGSVLETEGASLKVYHTPGHTDDHMVVVLAEENALFSGDCILGEGTAVFENLYTYMKSLELILNLKPSVIYPGHGPVIPNPVPKIEEYINHRNKREKQILDILTAESEKSFTVPQLTAIVYKDTPKNLLAAAAGNLSHHLEKLLEENLVEKTNSEEFKRKS